MKSAFFCNVPANVERVYGGGRKEKIGELTELYPGIVGAKDFDAHVAALADTEVIFSTWGMPPLSDAQLDQLPKLRAVFYAASSVKAFAEPLLKRGIQVVSAWGANAYPVAEFTVSQILLANKGYFRNLREFRSPETFGHPRASGNFGETVAIIGAGMVGRRVMEMLQAYRLQVVACDPYLSAEDAQALGVERVSLEEAFRRGITISNHMPDTAETRGILNGKLFQSMRDGATFINTGRGASVVEEDLIEALTQRPSLTALLDVTAPEPPVAGSRLYELPNALITCHIAGALGDEVFRMADCCIEECQALMESRPLRYGVSLERLKTMA